MKKLLLGSTALAGLLLGGAASAQQVTTKAPFTVNLNGDIRYTFAYSDSKKIDRGVENGLDARITVTADAKADNGLGYGFTGRFRNSGGDDMTYMDVKYVYMKGANWGEVRLGDQYGVQGLVGAPALFLADSHALGSASLISYGKPAAGLAPGILQQYASFSYLGLDTLTSVQYSTPVFGGFQASVFYAPEYEWGRNMLRGLNEKTASINAPYENVWQGAVRYKNSFGEGGAGVDLSAGYGAADRKGNATVGRYEMWYVGGNVSYQGFTVGGQYQDLGNSYQPLWNGSHTDWKAWSVGATYGLDPWLVGVVYGQTNFDRPGAAKDLKLGLWEVGGSYQLAPGLALQGSVMRYDVETAYEATGNKGTTVAVRTRLLF